MRKLFVFIFIYTFLHGAVEDPKSKLVSTIVKFIYPNKSIKLYIQDKDFKKVLANSKDFLLVTDCTQADFMIVDGTNNISHKCLNGKKAVFVTSYSSYRKDKNVLGAVFWQKGRLNIIFRNTRLKALSINLPTKYNNYIE